MTRQWQKSSGRSHSKVGPPFYTLVALEKVSLEEWLRWINLRLVGATSGKESIIGWEGQGEGFGYLRFQGGSPHVCQLRTASFWLC
jgi:hypothetical protein